MTTLDVGGISVAPCTRRRHAIELTELADGTRVSIPLDLINGAQPGPCLYLGAAIHGDEVDGVGILFRALADVDPKRLRGSVVCVPVQHPLSFHADHRLPISQFMKSPLDQAPADAWACFPGMHGGSLAQGLAATLFEMSPRFSRTSDERSIPSNSPPFRGWWSGRSCNVSGICWSVSAMTH